MGSLAEPPKLQIPLIDISGYIDGDATQAKKIASELRSACMAPGFFQITGHQVPASLRADLLSKLSQFFALPASTKQALHRSQSKCLRGYETVGEQKLEGGFSDQKEGFMIGPDFPADALFLQGPNQWPAEQDAPGLRQVYTNYFDEILNLSKIMFRLMALSLNLEETYFDEFVGNKDCEFLVGSPRSRLVATGTNSNPAISMCRAHRYPPTTPEMAEKSRGIGAHTDFGALTLLLQDDSEYCSS